MAVPASPSPSPERDFGGLKGFDLLRGDDGKYRAAKPDEYVGGIARLAKERATYQAIARRRGIPEIVTRRDRYPIQEYTVVFHPALSDWVQEQVVSGKDPRADLRKIAQRYLEAAEMLFEGKRVPLGFSCHADTDDIHLGHTVTRQLAGGQRVGKAGLGLVGPWVVSTDRQIRSGAKIDAQKAAQFARAMAKFRERYGDDRIPFDVELCRTLDQVAESVLGTDLQRLIAAYALRVPALEQAHTRAALAELDRARAQLAATLSTPSTADGAHPTIDPSIL